MIQVTNLKLESNMKEELLEAIYGTVERLEQKVDELSASPKNLCWGFALRVLRDWGRSILRS